MEKISIASLMDAGVHFGHQTRRWNPKMKPYIFGQRGDIYIINLKQTLYGLDAAYSFLLKLAQKGGTVLLVGTKKQAQEAVANAANNCGMPYVNTRWLGGMLTNFKTIRKRVKYMEELEAQENDGRLALLPKKEQILIRKELLKLQTNLNGVRNMNKLPDAVFVVDSNREILAVREAQRLNIPIVGILDTNSDPDDLDFPIPANDDAIRSVTLITDFISDAIQTSGAALVNKDEGQASSAVEDKASSEDKIATKAKDAAQTAVASKDKASENVKAPVSAKEEAKAGTKVATTKAETKDTAKSVKKTDTKAAGKADTKAAGKADTKAAEKADAKAAEKADAKAATDTKAKTTTKAAAKEKTAKKAAPEKKASVSAKSKTDTKETAKDAAKTAKASTKTASATKAAKTDTKVAATTKAASGAKTTVKGSAKDSVKDSAKDKTASASKEDKAEKKAKDTKKAEEK